MNGIFSDLTLGQNQLLLAPVTPERVKTRTQAGRSMSYLEAWDIRCHLNRFFGIAGWSLVNSDVVCLFEEPYEGKNGVPSTTVVYRATATLTIHRRPRRDEDFTYLPEDAKYTETAIDSMSGNTSTRAELHDNAAKSAQSGALKRCAVNLGDQFGLSLYNFGSTEPVVRKTLMDPPLAPDAPSDEGQPPSPGGHPGPSPEMEDAAGDPQ